MGYDLGIKVPDPKWAKDLLYSNVIGNFIYLCRNHHNDKYASSSFKIKWTDH